MKHMRKLQFKIKDDNQITTLKKLLSENGKIYTDNSFKIKGVEGRFSIDNDRLNITLTDKPFLASWDMVEDKISEFLRTI